MDRVIKFRGLSIVKNKWVYGDLAQLENKTLIKYSENGVRKADEVYSKTVGQFTGLYDTNGKEIYEGDLVKSGYMTGTILFAEASFLFRRFENDLIYILYPDEDYRIIGNIHETKEDN